MIECCYNSLAMALQQDTTVPLFVVKLVIFCEIAK